MIVAQADRSLTERQREVLDIIKDFISTKGYGPTVRELMRLYGVAGPNGVYCHIRALRVKGYLRPRPGDKDMARTILPVDPVFSDVGIGDATDIAALLAVCRKVLGLIGPLSPKLRRDLTRAVERVESRS